MRRSRVLLPFAFFLPATIALTLLTPKDAEAYERQWHAGLSLGYAYLATESSLHGLGGGLHLTYGINDMFNAMVELDVTGHPGGDLLTLSGSAGASYVIDILQVVPYVGVMAGGYDLYTVKGACGAVGQPACHSGRLGLSVPFGLDYTVTRNFNVGLAGRFHLLLLGPTGVEYMVTAFGRAELVWGY